MKVKIKKSDPMDLLGAWKVKEKCRKDDGMLRQDFITFSTDFSLNHSFVAKKEDKIVGFIIFRDTGYISIFGVHPDYREQGIGEKLVEKPKQKYNKLWCHVRETNQDAIEFYKAVGFKEARRVSSYYLNGDNAKIMVYEEN
ncbi:hypothetical protein C9439_02055 [archaeon SCG-AAA382B04]|nr:hypothetical protein C9439_02055 [archaeon SCG-AAA382B04]